MKARFFITGTDTDVGKTYVGVHLLNAFRKMGYSTLGLKPIAAGCYWENDQLYNQDALALRRASSIVLDYAAVNPFAFEPAIAPHIAAQKAGVKLNVESIMGSLNLAMKAVHHANMCLIEGVGGFKVPLNATETTADWVEELNIPIILVVGMRLGCINHALLTVDAILQRGLTLAGWIANGIDPDMQEQKINISTLTHWIHAPCLAILPFDQLSVTRGTGDDSTIPLGLDQQLPLLINTLSTCF